MHDRQRPLRVVLDLPPGTHSFPTKYAIRTSQMTFNIADYSRQLMNDFLIAGGVIETREFQSPQAAVSHRENAHFLGGSRDRRSRVARGEARQCTAPHERLRA